MSLEVSSMEARASMSLSMGKAAVPMADTRVSNEMAVSNQLYVFFGSPTIGSE